jgi:hypothetical protein
MAEAELSLIRFGVINFFSLIMNRSVFHPTQTTLCEIVKSIIDAEATPEKEWKEKVDFIYHKTDTTINEPLAIIELAVFKNIDKGLNKTIQFGDNKEFTIAELYHILNDIRWKLVEIVTAVVKKYTLEMPIEYSGMGMKIGFGNMMTGGIAVAGTETQPLGA